MSVLWIVVILIVIGLLIAFWLWTVADRARYPKTGPFTPRPPMPIRENERRWLVLNEIDDERRRQISKGYDARHDDKHRLGEIARGAACFAITAGYWPSGDPKRAEVEEHEHFWPWPFAIGFSMSATAREDLLKAAAMCVAEIERLDRLNAPVKAD